MIVVKLKGGMGNQMFQYAFGKYLATKYNTEIKLDLSFLLDRIHRENFVFRNYDLDIFKLKEVNFAKENDLAKFGLSNSRLLNLFYKRILGHTNKYLVIREKHFHFDDNELSFPNNVYLDGYWQSEKYFIDIENEIRSDFGFKNKLFGECKNLAEIIESIQSVCVHVRRADFVHLESSAKIHGFIGQDYFYKAVDLLSEIINDFEIFVFSDNIDWCIENLSFTKNTTFVTHVYKDEKIGNHLHLMTKCKHFIISNSTFSWWGAWLSNNHDKIVVAPKRWFADEKMNNQTQDLIPESWIRL